MGTVTESSRNKYSSSCRWILGILNQYLLRQGVGRRLLRFWAQVAGLSLEIDKF